MVKKDNSKNNNMSENDSEKVLDFNKKRQENIERKRRAVERIMFDNFLGTYSVIDTVGSIYKIHLIDISRNGCLFQIPLTKEAVSTFNIGFESTLRLYFTKGSYIPAHVTVKYTNEHQEQDGTVYLRLGCEFDTTIPSFSALESFINFLYKFAEHSAIDRGDSKVYFL